MRLTRVVATISALCLVTGLVVYGGMFLWPRLAGSSPEQLPITADGDAQKEILQYISSIGSGSGPTRPNAVAVDGNGRVYVTDAGAAKVFVYSMNGRQLYAFGGPGTGKKNFAFPNGIAVTRNGDLIIADSVNNEIKVFNEKGRYLRTLLDKSMKIKPGIISKGPGGLIYVSDLLNHQILVMDEQGKILRTVTDPEHPLDYPQGTAVDREGRLWVADGGNYAIKIFDARGKMADLIKGGGEPETPFSLVRGIGFDKTGRAFITDTIAHVIRVFDSEGKQLEVFPSSRQDPSRLVYPTHIFIDDQERLFVVDRGANDVKVFSIKKQLKMQD